MISIKSSLRICQLVFCLACAIAIGCIASARTQCEVARRNRAAGAEPLCLILSALDARMDALGRKVQQQISLHGADIIGAVRQAYAQHGPTPRRVAAFCWDLAAMAVRVLWKCVLLAAYIFEQMLQAAGGCTTAAAHAVHLLAGLMEASAKLLRAAQDVGSALERSEDVYMISLLVGRTVSHTLGWMVPDVEAMLTRASHAVAGWGGAHALVPYSSEAWKPAAEPKTHRRAASVEFTNHWEDDDIIIDCAVQDDVALKNMTNYTKYSRVF